MPFHHFGKNAEESVIIDSLTIWSTMGQICWSLVYLWLLQSLLPNNVENLVIYKNKLFVAIKVKINQLGRTWHI